MGIREKVNQNQSAFTVLICVMVVVVIGFVIWQEMPHSAKVPTQAFYSDDDGATYFKDDINKIPPFDHNGKQAVRAAVFKSGGPPFVAYLEKFSDVAKKRMETIQTSAAQNPRGISVEQMMGTITQEGHLVKKPGAGNPWVESISPDGAKVTQLSASDSNANFEIVNP